MFIPIILMCCFLLVAILAAMTSAQDRDDARKRLYDLELAIQAVRTLIANNCPANQVALNHLQKAEWYEQQAKTSKHWSTSHSYAINGLFEAQLARDLANASATGKSGDSSETQTK